MQKSEFLWGSATASYQCEGAWNLDGKGVGEWDVFCLLYTSSGHAGATPMNDRQDPVLAMTEWIRQITESARQKPYTVATVGCIQTFPGSTNVICDHAVSYTHLDVYKRQVSGPIDFRKSNRHNCRKAG